MNFLKKMNYWVCGVEIMNHEFSQSSENYPYKGLQIMSPREYKKLIERVC